MAKLFMAPAGSFVPNEESKDETTDVTVLSDSELQAAQQALEERLAKEQAEKLAAVDKEISDPDAEGQIVSIPKPQVEVRSDDAKLLAEYDSTAGKQTQTRKKGGSATQPPSGAAVGIDSPRAADPKKLAGDGRAAQSGSVVSSGGSAAEQGTRPDGFDGADLPENGGMALPKRGSGGSAGGDGTGQERSLPRLGTLRPSQESLERAATGGGVGDYLADVQEGDERVLSTKQWRFASFFNRLKSEVSQHWHPDVAYQLRDPSGKVYGSKNRLTVLRVSIDPKGKLKDVFLEQPSGVDFLDEEAESALRKAQPFLNPPEQLVSSETGMISFRFGFLLEVGSAPRFRVFRYNN